MPTFSDYTWIGEGRLQRVGNPPGIGSPFSVGQLSPLRGRRFVSGAWGSVCIKKRALRKKWKDRNCSLILGLQLVLLASSGLGKKSVWLLLTFVQARILYKRKI